MNARTAFVPSTVIGVLLVLVTACASPRVVSPDIPPEVLDKRFVHEVLRHLYRWYLDEVDIANRPRQTDIDVWVRALTPPLDAGDRSRFAELVLPSLGIVVVAKKADYTVEDMGLTVKNEHFMIARVSREVRNPSPEYRELHFNYAATRDELFRTRSLAVFPDENLLERMRTAVRHQITLDERWHGRSASQGEQIVHLAPLSPVANEAWIFWETGRLLIQFSSDIDLSNPAVWDHDEMSAVLYDIDEQVVVSLDEAPGSNAYLTRDQVGRALYNCIVLGRKVVLQPVRGAGAGESSGTTKVP